MVEWKKTKLGELSEKITKGSTPTTYGYKFLDRGVPFVKVENLANGKVSRESITQYISGDAHRFQKRSQLQAGDVLFSIAGTIGRVAIVTDKDVPANTNQAVAIIRGVTKHFIPDFLKMQLDSHVSLKVKSKARGGAMNNISLDDLKGMDVVVPPFDVQENIVRVVETQFTRLDAAIKSLKAITAKLELYRKSVLKAAFELEDASVSNIEGISNFIGSGITPKGSKKHYRTEGIPFIRSQNIYPFKFVTDGLVYVNSSLHEEMRRTHTLQGDVLLNITGASIGRCAVIPDILDQANVNQHVCIIRTKENILPQYLCAFLNSPLGQNQIMRMQGGVTRQGLNYQQIRKLRLPLPSVSRQKKIIDEIESRFSIIDNLGKVIGASLAKAEKLRKSILKSAFEGKLI